MDKIEIKLPVDGAETTFVIRKPTFLDEIEAMEKSGLPAFDARGASRATAAQQMRMALHRLSRCIAEPLAYRDAAKLGGLPSEDIAKLQDALSTLTEVSPKSEAPSEAPSSPGT